MIWVLIKSLFAKQYLICSRISSTFSFFSMEPYVSTWKHVYVKNLQFGDSQTVINGPHFILLLIVTQKNLSMEIIVFKLGYNDHVAIKNKNCTITWSNTLTQQHRPSRLKRSNIDGPVVFLFVRKFRIWDFYLYC